MEVILSQRQVLLRSHGAGRSAASETSSLFTDEMGNNFDHENHIYDCRADNLKCRPT